MTNPRQILPPSAPNEEPEEDLTSRTDEKTARQAEEEMLMRLGKTLVELNERMLLNVGLPDATLGVIQDARRVTAMAAKNRAMRLVRASLRDLDARQIQRRIKDLQDPPVGKAKEPGPLVKWRDRLVAGGDDDLDAFVAEFAAADRQQIRQLSRNARKATESTRQQSLHALANVLRKYVR